MKNVIDIQCGLYCSLFLTELGEVFGCGLKSNIGCLGQGVITNIACGKGWTMYLDDKGKVYCPADGSRRIDVYEPMGEYKIKSISCVEQHGGAVDFDGKFILW